jgi:protein-S-isoprenylcysteine O-methyltransferase Ste14
VHPRSLTVATPSPDAFRKRRASDWAGFIGHLSIVAVSVIRTPSLTLFVLPSYVHMMLAAGSFLIRDQPRRLEQNVWARIVAYAGGFGVFAFVQLTVAFKPEWLVATTNPGVGLAGIALALIGTFLEIWAVCHLRFAFSTEPAARRLVTSGPYRLARHPIYSGGCLVYLGLLLTHPTIPLMVALLAWGMCIGFRMRYEEAILTQAFPEYEDYRRRVGALLPWTRVISADRPTNAVPATEV